MSFNNDKDELISDDEIHELIKIGKYYSSAKIQDIKKNIENIKLNFNQDIQYNLHKYFEYNNQGYSKSELSYIFIGIVVGEVYLRDGEDGSEWGYGSVTATNKIYNILKKEYPLRAKVMKKWSGCFGFWNYYWFK